MWVDGVCRGHVSRHVKPSTHISIPFMAKEALGPTSRTSTDRGDRSHVAVYEQLHGSFRQSLAFVGFRCPVSRIPKDSRPIALLVHVRSSPAPKGVCTRSHCRRVRKECGRTAGPTFDTCRSSEEVDVASLKNRSGDPQTTHIRYPRRSCRGSLMEKDCTCSRLCRAFHVNPSAVTSLTKPFDDRDRHHV